jgi:hypothetical protein
MTVKQFAQRAEISLSLASALFAVGRVPQLRIARVWHPSAPAHPSAAPSQRTVK